jgi:hypothetical protein
MDFIGSDGGSPQEDCAAVWRDPVSGDFHFRGRLTDPALASRFGLDVSTSTDEIDVWLPARMADVVREALDGYEEGRQGPGNPSFEFLLEHTERSAVHMEMRDAYDSEPEFERWKENGSIEYDWARWIKMLAPHIERGVKFRRLRVISEPVSDYIRWEQAISYGNVEAGEELRWLPRSRAYDLVLPGADFWMFDQRRVRFGLQQGDGSRGRYEFSSDPRVVRQIVASFEMAWERAIPHEEYRPA